MKLITDASIVIAALLGSKITKEILLSDSIELYTPKYLFEELEKHKQEIDVLSKLSLQDRNKLFDELKSKIKVVPKEQFDMFLTKANELISDKDDTEYLALSLSANNCPIWSNDLHFKEQLIVSVYTTKELLDLLTKSEEPK